MRDIVDAIRYLTHNAASVQDRDAAVAVEPAAGVPHCQAGMGRRRLRREAGHLGQTQLSLAAEIVKRPDDLHTFQVLPRRWVVERTLSWIIQTSACLGNAPPCQ